MLIQPKIYVSNQFEKLDCDRLILSGVKNAIADLAVYVLYEK